MSDGTARLFAAILLPPPVKSMLCGAISELGRQATGSFTRPQNLHITMAFIGETSRITEAAEALRLASANHQAFEIAVGGLGHFGDLWWVGAQGGEPLISLSADLRSELIAKGLPIDTKPFHPHITIARRVKAAVPPRLNAPTVGMTAGRLSLMRSDRIEGRLTYTEVAGFNFTK